MGVGKSNIMKRFAYDEYSDNTRTTIGIEGAIKRIEIAGNVIKTVIMDTAGQERFRAIPRAYYRDAQGVLLVYDITRYSSFINLVKWVQELHLYAPEDMVVMIIGNKVDMKDERRVSTEEAKEFAGLFLDSSFKISI